jgi:hypothetical protein
MGFLGEILAALGPAVFNFVADGLNVADSMLPEGACAGFLTE